MIEVVVLRCHPISAQPDAGKPPVLQSRTTKTPSDSVPAGKSLKIATTLPLSDDSSASSETSGPFIGMFDGAGDEAPRKGTVLPFGGNAGWNSPLPQTSRGTQQQGASSTRPDVSTKPVNEGSRSGSAAGSVVHSQWHGRSQSRNHFNQDWSQSGRPSSQINHSRNSPQTQAQGKTDGVTGKEAANRIVIGSQLGAPGNTGEPLRPGPTVQGTAAATMNTNQADLLPGRWGKPVSPAVSEVDSWATRHTPYTFGKAGCQATQEPREPRQPNTSWQAPAEWSEVGRSRQASGDTKDVAKGPAYNTPLANPPTLSDANNVGNKDPVSQSVLLGTVVKLCIANVQQKDVSWNTVNTDTARAGWPIPTNAVTSGHSGIWESNERDSWDSIPPTGGMPGAWWSNDDEKINDATGWGSNAASAEQGTRNPSRPGNETSNTAQKKSGGPQAPAVVDPNKQTWGGKREAVPGGLGTGVYSNTQSWLRGESKNVDTSNNQPEDKTGYCVLEEKVSPGSETHASKPPLSGETAQPTGWAVPPDKGQGKSSFLDKIKNRLGSPSPPKSATNSAEHDKNQSEMPTIRTSSGPGFLATGKLSSPIPLSQLSHQLQESSSEQRPQQASVVASGGTPHLTAAEVYRKPYWSTKNKSSARPQSTTGDGHSDMYLGPEDSLYTIPEEVVQRKYTSHQVHQGRPVLYAHKTAKPKYMDSHESPYAVFVFNYRSEGK